MYKRQTEYKAAQNSLRLYERFTGCLQNFTLKPQIVMLKAFSLTVYQSDETLPSNFWNKYNAKRMSQKLSGGRITEDYGVSFWNTEKNSLDYYIGIRSELARGDLTKTLQIKIPEGLYAVFTTPPSIQNEFVSTINKTWNYINYTWLPRSCYSRTGGYEFECYTEQSKNFTEDIYIPVTKTKMEEL